MEDQVPALLIAAISALASALAVVAKTAYQEVRAERDWLRSEIMATLVSMGERDRATVAERDRAIVAIRRDLTEILRLLTGTSRRRGGT